MARYAGFNSGYRVGDMIAFRFQNNDMQGEITGLYFNKTGKLKLFAEVWGRTVEVSPDNPRDKVTHAATDEE